MFLRELAATFARLGFETVLTKDAIPPRESYVSRNAVCVCKSATTDKAERFLKQWVEQLVEYWCAENLRPPALVFITEEDEERTWLFQFFVHVPTTTGVK